MNITSLTLTAKSSGATSVETDRQQNPAHSDDNKNFASALKEQHKSLHEKASVEQAPASKRAHSESSEPIEQKKQSDEHKELVALIEQYLPPAQADQTGTDINASENSLLMAENNQPAASPTDFNIDLSTIQNMQASSVVNATANNSSMQAMSLDTENNVSTPAFLSQNTAGLEQISQNTETQKLATTETSESFSQLLDAVSEAVKTEKPATELGSALITATRQLENRVETAVIAKPINHPGWSKDLGEQILWMNNKDISAAEIKLNPLHLGPISVRIDVGQDNQTSILFSAQHAETKEALEASIPKLREMLQGQQLNLVNVNISQHSNPHNSRQTANPFQNTLTHDESSLEADTNILENNMNELVINKGLVSIYA